MNMAWLLLRHTEATAARIALLGDRIPGPELVRLGVAFSSPDDGAVMEAAVGLGQRLAEHEPDGVRRIKRSLRTTNFDGTAAEWFARPLAADTLRRPMQPVAARDS